MIIAIMTETAAAVADVSAAQAGASHGAVDMSIKGMFMQADLVVKSVMVSLVLASFWCWGLIISKTSRFEDVKAKARKFEGEFWSADALENYYDKLKRRRKHPFSAVFMAAMEEWFRSNKNKTGRSAQHLAPSSIDRIAKVMSVARNRELDKLESGLGVLASVGSAAPFVGLFGTVWGIMNSFQSIAYSNNTSLAVVAPGIAEALLATAIGLFAAIPAVLAYNRFSGKLAKFAGEIEDFETEFLALLSRQSDEARV